MIEIYSDANAGLQSSDATNVFAAFEFQIDGPAMDPRVRGVSAANSTSPNVSYNIIGIIKLPGSENGTRNLDWREGIPSFRSLYQGLS
ncbi:hypothetical protein X777_09658 [Ooceraea biroi]|uniref:Uncharacterized protein n=1 Tax=Ooceraea biroi TaxID=2015173 RepID=A0A026W8N6_OOCBI|nr:hypothetical protein X777_09658 [Ooceraea biroi]